MAASGQPTAPRVAVVLQGEATDPHSWSGVPGGLYAGLAAAGAEAVAVDARAPGASRLAGLLGRSWAQQAASPALAAASGAWASAALRRRDLDGVVAIGSGYRLRTALPLVTFEDETVAQALRQQPSPLAELSERAAGRWRQRQRRIYLGARGCCTASDWAASSIREDYGIDPAKVHVVGFGRNFDPLPAERDWSSPRFIFLGVDWERKRGPAVLEAFAAVRERHPGASLDVVGVHPPLDAAGVSGHGRLSLRSPPQRAQLTELLARATCLVLPSTFEAYGIAYLDAGAAGVPSIGTTVGGAADAVGDGGLLVSPDDQPALVAAMLELSDPATAQRLGERARAHATPQTWRAVAERVLRALGLSGLS
jgi:glycosyltransferase involved in cell wall biosynthesis